MQPAIWAWASSAGIPMLGICYGFQEMTYALGGKVEAAPEREFGHAQLTVLGAAANTEGPSTPVDGGGDLFAGMTGELKVWMSHGDKITTLAPGFVPVASTPSCEFAAVAAVRGGSRMWGLQFHPEVSHTPCGSDLLKNFVVRVAGCAQNWTMASFLEGASRIYL